MTTPNFHYARELLQQLHSDQESSLHPQLLNLYAAQLARQINQTPLDAQATPQDLLNHPNLHMVGQLAHRLLPAEARDATNPQTLLEKLPAADAALAALNRRPDLNLTRPEPSEDPSPDHEPERPPVGEEGSDQQPPEDTPTPPEQGEQEDNGQDSEDSEGGGSTPGGGSSTPQQPSPTPPGSGNDDTDTDTGTTLRLTGSQDLRSQSLSIHDTLWVEVVELNEQGGKGDASAPGTRQSDQLIQLPSLNALQGQLVIENFTLASTPVTLGNQTWVVETPERTLDYTLTFEQAGVTSLQAQDYLSFFIEGPQETDQRLHYVLTPDDLNADGSARFQMDGRDFTARINEEQQLVLSTATHNSGTGSAPIWDTVIHLGRFVPEGVNRTLTNDQLDWGELTATELQQAIDAISIDRDTQGWADVTFKFNEEQGGGRLVMDNLLRWTALETQLLRSDTTVAVTADTNTFNQASEIAEIIGLLSEGDSFVFTG